MAASGKGHRDGVEITAIGGLYVGPLEKKYWSSSRGREKYPYPLGYQATRWHGGHIYYMDVSEGPRGPLFGVTCEEGIACSGQTPSAPWEDILKKRHAGAKKILMRSSASSIDGPEMFGFTSPLVQRLCRDLVVSASGAAERSGGERSGIDINGSPKDGNLGTPGADSGTNVGQAESSGKSSGKSTGKLSGKSPVKVRQVNKLLKSMSQNDMDPGTVKVERILKRSQTGKLYPKTKLLEQGKRKLDIQEDGNKNLEKLTKAGKGKLQDVEITFIKSKEQMKSSLSIEVGSYPVFGHSEDEEVPVQNTRTKRPRSSRYKVIPTFNELPVEVEAAVPAVPAPKSIPEHGSESNVTVSVVVPAKKKRLKGQGNIIEKATTSPHPINSEQSTATVVDMVEDSVSPEPAKEEVANPLLLNNGETLGGSQNGSSPSQTTQDTLQDSANVNGSLPKSNRVKKKRPKVAKPDKVPADKVPDSVELDKYGTNVDLTQSDGVLSIDLIIPSAEEMQTSEARPTGKIPDSDQKESGSGTSQDGVFLLLEACKLASDKDGADPNAGSNEKVEVDVKRKRISDSVEEAMSPSEIPQVSKSQRLCSEESNSLQSTHNVLYIPPGEVQKSEGETTEGGVISAPLSTVVAMEEQSTVHPEVPGTVQLEGSIQGLPSITEKSSSAAETKCKNVLKSDDDPMQKGESIINCNSSLVKPLDKLSHGDEGPVQAIVGTGMQSQSLNAGTATCKGSAVVSEPPVVALYSSQAAHLGESPVESNHLVDPIANHQPISEAHTLLVQEEVTTAHEILPDEGFHEVQANMIADTGSHLPLSTAMAKGRSNDQVKAADDYTAVTASVPDVIVESTETSMKVVLSPRLDTPEQGDQSVKVPVVSYASPGPEKTVKVVPETTDVSEGGGMNNDLILPTKLIAESTSQETGEVGVLQEVAIPSSFEGPELLNSGAPTVTNESVAEMPVVAEGLCTAVVPPSGLNNVAVIQAAMNTTPKSDIGPDMPSLPEVLPSGTQVMNEVVSGTVNVASTSSLEAPSLPSKHPGDDEMRGSEDGGVSLEQNSVVGISSPATVFLSGVELRSEPEPSMNFMVKIIPEGSGVKEVPRPSAELALNVQIMTVEDHNSMIQSDTLLMSSVREIPSVAAEIVPEVGMTTPEGSKPVVVSETVSATTVLADIPSLPVLPLSVEDGTKVIEEVIITEKTSVADAEVPALPVVLPEDIEVDSGAKGARDLAFEIDQVAVENDQNPDTNVSFGRVLQHGVVSVLSPRDTVDLVTDTLPEESDIFLTADNVPGIANFPSLPDGLPENTQQATVGFGRDLDQDAGTGSSHNYVVALVANSGADVTRKGTSEPTNSTKSSHKLRPSDDVLPGANGLLIQHLDEEKVSVLVAAMKEIEPGAEGSFGKVDDNGVVTVIAASEQVDLLTDTVPEEEVITQAWQDLCNDGQSNHGGEDEFVEAKMRMVDQSFQPSQEQIEANTSSDPVQMMETNGHKDLAKQLQCSEVEGKLSMPDTVSAKDKGQLFNYNINQREESGSTGFFKQFKVMDFVPSETSSRQTSWHHDLNERVVENPETNEVVEVLLNNELVRNAEVAKSNVDGLSLPSTLVQTLEIAARVAAEPEEVGGKHVLVKGVQHEVSLDETATKDGVSAKRDWPMSNDIGLLHQENEKSVGFEEQVEDDQSVTLGLEEYASIMKAGLENLSPFNSSMDFEEHDDVPDAAIPSSQEGVFLGSTGNLPSQGQLNSISQGQSENTDSFSLTGEVTKSMIGLLVPSAGHLSNKIVRGESRSLTDMDNAADLKEEILLDEGNTAMEIFAKDKELLSRSSNVLSKAPDVEVGEDKIGELADGNLSVLEIQGEKLKAREPVVDGRHTDATVMDLMSLPDKLVDGVGPDFKGVIEPKEVRTSIASVVFDVQSKEPSQIVVPDLHVFGNSPITGVQVDNSMGVVAMEDANLNSIHDQTVKLVEPLGVCSWVKVNGCSSVKASSSSPTVSSKLPELAKEVSVVAGELQQSSNVLDYEGLPTTVKDLSGSKRMESIFFIDHSMAVTAMVLHVRGKEILLCVICQEDQERTFFVYKVLHEGDESLKPVLLTTKTCTFEPSSLGPINAKIFLEETAVKFTPDGRQLVLLNCFKLPEESYLDESKAGGHGVNIVSFENDDLQVLEVLQSDNLIQCLTIPGPQLLVGGGDNGCVTCWEMDASWRTCTAKFVLPRAIFKGTPFASVTKLSAMSGSPSIVLGCDDRGSFAMWDTSSRVLLSSWHVPNHYVVRGSLVEIIPTTNFEESEVLGKLGYDIPPQAHATGDHLSGGLPPVLLTLVCNQTESILIDNENGANATEAKAWDCKAALLKSDGLVFGRNLVSRASAVTALGRYGIVGTDDGLVHIWEVASGQTISEFHELEGTPIVVVATNPSAAVFASANAKGRLILYIEKDDLGESSWS